MLICYFLSFFTPKERFNIRDIEPKKPLSRNFSISRRNRRKILAALINKKMWRPNRLPSYFSQKTSVVMAEILQKIFTNVKGLQKMPVTWKTGGYSHSQTTFIVWQVVFIFSEYKKVILFIINRQISIQDFATRKNFWQKNYFQRVCSYEKTMKMTWNRPEKN